MTLPVSAPPLHPGCAGTARWRYAGAFATVLLAGLLLPSGAILAGESPAGDRRVTAGEFAAEIARLQSRARTLTNSPQTAQEFAAALPAQWIVGEPPQRVSAAPLEEAAEDYARLPAGSAGLRAKIDSQLRELAELAAELDARGSAAAPPAAAQAHARLASILSRRDFQSALRQNQWELWKAHMLYWLSRKLASLLRGMPLHGKVGNALAWMLVLALVVWLAIWLLRRFLRREIAAEEPAAVEAAQVGWQDWYRDAQEAAGAGRFRDAVHALYWAGISRLEDLQALSRDRARTPRESLRQLASRAAARAALPLAPPVTAAQRSALASLTRALERCWYGNRPASHEDFRAALALAEDLGCRPS